MTTDIKKQQSAHEALGSLADQADASLTRPQRSSSGLAAQLDGFLAAHWAELLQKFFAAMPDALTRIAERSRNPAEQNRCYEILRIIQLRQAPFVRRFTHEIGRRLQPELRAAESQSTPAVAATVEETLLLSEVQAQIQSRHKLLIDQWTARVDSLRRHMKLALSAEALSAAGISAALRAAVESLDIPAEQRRLFYQVFQSTAVAPVEGLLRDMLHFFDTHNVGAPIARAAPVPAAVAATATELDAQTRRVLETMAATPQGTDYDDNALARDLLKHAQQPDSALAQRLILAGFWLNQLLADALIPESLKKTLDELRFPLVKAALCDASWFKNTAHPIRVLVNELAGMGAASRVGVQRDLQRTLDLVREVLVQFNLRASFVLEALNGETRIEEADVQRFLVEQNRSSAARREEVTHRARLSVHQTIESHTLGRDIPAAAQPFIVNGWGALLKHRLLRYGWNSEPWKAAEARLDQVLDLLDRRDAQDPKLPKLSDLISGLGAELQAEGLPDAQIGPMLTGLRSAYQAPKVQQEISGSLVSETALPLRGNHRRRPDARAERESASPRRRAAPVMEGVEIPSAPPRPAERPRSAAPQRAEAPAETVGEPVVEAAPAAVARPRRPAAPAAAPVPAPAAPAAAVATPADDPLAILLKIGHWFRVHDRGQNKPRWLQLAEYDPEQNRVCFAGFDGATAMRMRASRFAEDLAAKRAEPINPTLEMMEALRRLPPPPSS